MESFFNDYRNNTITSPQSVETLFGHFPGALGSSPLSPTLFPTRSRAKKKRRGAKPAAPNLQGVEGRSVTGHAG